jgi:putative membrane protein
MFWPHHGNWWGFPGLVILAGFIILIVVLVKNDNIRTPFTQKNFYQGNAMQNETALDILNKRYAKGEISKEQYDQMKQDMGI